MTNLKTLQHHLRTHVLHHAGVSMGHHEHAVFLYVTDLCEEDGGEGGETGDGD